MDDFNFFEDFSEEKKNSPFTQKIIDVLKTDSHVYEEAIGNFEANEEEKGASNISYLLFRNLLLLALINGTNPEEKDSLTGDEIEAILQSAETDAKNLNESLKSFMTGNTMNSLMGGELHEGMENMNPFANLDIDEEGICNNGNGFPMFPPMMGGMPDMPEGSGIVPIGFTSPEELETFMKIVSTFMMGDESKKEEFKKLIEDNSKSTNNSNDIADLFGDDNNTESSDEDDDFDF